jgi:hypothetical protein
VTGSRFLQVRGAARARGWPVLERAVVVDRCHRDLRRRERATESRARRIRRSHAPFAEVLHAPPDVVIGERRAASEERAERLDDLWGCHSFHRLCPRRSIMPVVATGEYSGGPARRRIMDQRSSIHLASPSELLIDTPSQWWIPPATSPTSASCSSGGASGRARRGVAAAPAARN